MTIEPEDWEAQEPPLDFADQVMARVNAETGARVMDRRRSLSVRAGIFGGLAMAAAVALAIGWRGAKAADHGDAIAKAREEVRLGGRAIAVLERGAQVSWHGDEVNQPAGDVFYRVEPGSTFRVHTPAGDVQVLGTCFRVSVENAGDASDEERRDAQVNARDVKVGTVGALLSAAAFVSVYEGKVAFSQPGHGGGAGVTLTAGESARADERGVARTSATERDGASGEAVASDAPLVAANANLADSVRDYKRRLEAIEAQKAALDKQLAEAQQKLASSQRDGAAGPERSAYDLTPDDWKTLAQEGMLRARFPCIQRGQKEDDLSKLQALGLPPQDGPLVAKALAASRARIWATVRPLCASALGGDPAAADRLGVSTCEGFVRETAEAAGEDVRAEMRTVAEIRAGSQPLPSDGGSGIVKMMYELTGESNAVESELANEIGPEAAKEVVFGKDSPVCWSSTAWTVGSEPVLPPK